MGRRVIESSDHTPGHTHSFTFIQALTVTADPPTLVTRLSRVQVIRDQARLESLCAAKVNTHLSWMGFRGSLIR